MTSQVMRRCSAIELPLGSRRQPVFAMVGEASADIAALGSAFESHNKVVQAALTDTNQKIDAINAEIDKLNEKQAAMTLSGRGEAGNGLRKELNAVAKFFRKKDDSDLMSLHAGAAGSLAEINNSMSVGSDPDGGYFVLPALSNTMTKKLFDVTAMRRLARVETISAGDRWEEPIDNGDTGSGWVGENDSRPSTSSPKIGKLSIPLNELYAMPPVTQALLDMVGFDLGSWLLNKITDRFGRDEGYAFLGGDGVGKPRGLLTYPISTAADDTRPWGTIQYLPTGAAGGFKTGSTPPDTGDCLRDLTWKLRTPYRQGASWLMNSNTISQIDKIKDGQGNYLFRPSMTAGAPSSLLGYPVEIDDVAMPDIGANSLSIAFGNFQKAYVIVDRIGIKLLVDPFSAKPIVLFYAYKRVGGGLANSEAVKFLRFSVN
ncbi:phage major capsid protein [Afipia felis]|uniref:Predicted phage phi-C31 gp36 major capsid-like protein n=2 Tax=Afipia felis TaxID=1035 RepID=A0A380W7Y3_AFIFE|nr:phage major capsid protein [Afipia felis]EKS28236.1 HK97 family phage major capsid protein [Afipia felis ATCC 53690]SUU76946.1 Predicted phage phi-C31 gp36 major capsid-like protein [Afipia felis]SUU85012.1 Predicted phage phi-C31 gp36 major capsid-like protein [Afipia felis]